jgi:HD superfamily phosphohydrolase
MTVSTAYMLMPPRDCRFDYIARDCYHLVGQQPNVELERLIHSSRVIDGEVCWEYKDAMSLHNVCHTRYTLHKMYYSHKTGSPSSAYKDHVR